MTEGIEWERPPDYLAAGIEHFIRLLGDQVGRVAFEEGQEAENWMKERRPWKDQTGNARRGLRTDIERQGPGKGGVIIYFIHSVEYGVDLELDHGGRYAIIRPALDRTVPRLRRKLDGLMDQVNIRAGGIGTR